VDTTGIIIGVVIGGVAVLILIIAILFLLSQKRKLDMSALPKEVRYFYDDYYESPKKWSHSGSDTVKCYTRKLDPESKLWSHMLFLLKSYCMGRGVEVEEAYAVFNPTLVGGFISQLYVFSFPLWFPCFYAPLAFLFTFISGKSSKIV
jgi:hypothetical protein